MALAKISFLVVWKEKLVAKTLKIFKFKQRQTIAWLFLTLNLLLFFSSKKNNFCEISLTNLEQEDYNWLLNQKQNVGFHDFITNAALKESE